MDRLRREIERPAVVDSFTALISETLGLQIDESEREKLKEFVAERTRARDLGHPQDYLLYLQGHRIIADPEWAQLIETLTNRESYFFRDEGQFALLERWIIPELQAQGRPQLRVWSAGCAGGEEVYSLAILIGELRKNRPEQRMEVVGTDLNSAAVAHARRGVYSEWSLRRVEPSVRDRCFEHNHHGWRLRAEFRQGTEFHTANLLEMRPPGEFDLVVCRNVLIYLTQDARTQALKNLISALRPGGYLMTGHNELVGARLGELVPRLLPEGLVYRREPDRPQQAVLVPRHADGRPRARKPKRRGTPLPKCRHPGRPLPRASAPAPTPRAPEESWSLANTGRLEDAKRSLHGALGKEPTDPLLHFLLAYIEIQEGRDAEARRHLKRTLYLDPGFIPAYVEFATLHDREGNGRAAQRIRNAGAEALARLPEDTLIAPYEGVTAGQLLTYLREQKGVAEGGGG